MKRKLICSFFFDCGTARNSMYLPACTFFEDLYNKEKPLQLCVKYAWQDFTVNYPINERVKEKYRRFGELLFLEIGKQAILDRLQYDGKFEVNPKQEFYFSPQGKKFMDRHTK